MTRQECESNIGWVDFTIPSSDPNREPYTVMLPPWDDGGFCNCAGFLYRGDCRHMRYARNTRCQWTSDRLPKQTPDQRRLQECPLCARKTRTIVYADDD